MLFTQRTGIPSDVMVNTILFTDPTIVFHKIKVLCEDEDKCLKIMDYGEAKLRKLHIVAKLRSNFESSKPIELHNSYEGHLHNCYHDTLPMYNIF